LHWESIFFVLAIVAIANGMNLIDGVNGLCGIVSLSMLLSICFLSYKLGDTVILSAAFNLIILVIPFMIINYPYGKIFLGDLGAYSLGLICSILTIILFGRHPEISPWAAVLIVIYPLIEVIFSILRRLSEGSSVYRPDTSHLHLRIYYFFKRFPPFAKIANSIVMPILSFIWLFPLITIPWVYKIPIFILFAMLIFLGTYLAMYYAVSAKK
jgi:UDP-N-acetylmuramyl pentapeptide phosphotransferase/UDP-N-acetylglucosamine-1-phosphate transferase